MKPFIKEIHACKDWEEYKKTLGDIKDSDLSDIKIPVTPYKDIGIPQIIVPVKSIYHGVVSWVYITGWKLSFAERLKVLFFGRIYNYSFPTVSGQPYTISSSEPPTFRPAKIIPEGHKTLTDVATPLEFPK